MAEKKGKFAVIPHRSTASVPTRNHPLAVGLAIALALPAGSIAASVGSAPIHRSQAPSASTLPVSSCADDGSAGTLRSVVAAAASGDTVDLSQLSCSTITLTQGEIGVLQNDLTLHGPGASTLTIDGGGVSGVISHQGTGTLGIDGIALTNNIESPTGNASGSCLYSAGNLHVDRSVVRNCYASNFGGGVFAKGNTYIGYSTVANNFAGLAGGGVWSQNGGNVTIVGSTISGNRAHGNGGGIVTVGSSATLTLKNSTVSGNSSDSNAGGISAYYASTRIYNSTISFNESGTRCPGGSGGIFQVYGSMEAVSSIVAGNLGNHQPDDICGYQAPVSGSDNIVVASNLALPGDTISQDPLLLPLADNGGLTYTHALAVGSPAIDAGSNPLSLMSDQRGIGYSRTQGTAADIGAFETQQPFSAPGVTKVFAPQTIAVDNLSTLTITLGNGSTSEATLSSPLTDALPAQVVLADPPNASTTCPQGTVTAIPGSGSLGLSSGARIPPQGSCTITATVLAHAAGTFANIIPAGALQTDSGSNPDAATAILTVTGQPVPPTLTKAFAPATIAAGQTSTLTITLANSHPNAATLTADLTDDLPAPLVVADPPHATTTCPGATVVAPPGSGTVTLPGGARIPAGTCSVSVSVTANDAGAYLNTIPAGALQTDFGSNPDAARAGLTVTPAVPTDRIFADGFDG